MNKQILLFCIILPFLLSACGAATTTPASSTPSSPPVTVTDCGGRQTTYTNVPTRLVPMESESAYMLVALGLRERIVGTPYFSEALPPSQELLAEMKKIPRLSEDYPSKEVLLGANPDFVFSVYPSAFSHEYSLYTQDELKKLNISSYLGLGQCPKQERLNSIETTFTDLLNLGKIFRVEDRAQKMVREMRTQLADIQNKVKNRPPVRVFEFEGNSGEPYTAGGTGTANAVITLAGGKNIFSDLPKPFHTATWEEVVERDPEVIWLMPLKRTKNSDAMKAFLLSYPPLANVTAIKQQRFVEIPLRAGGTESIQNVQAIALLAHALHPEVVP